MDQKEVILKKIGSKLKAIRMEQNIPLKVVASKLNLTTQAFGNIENGKADISVIKIFAICEILNTSFSDVLNIDNNNSLHYNAYNNSGGYFVQKVDVLNTTEKKEDSFDAEKEILGIKEDIQNLTQIILKQKK